MKSRLGGTSRPWRPACPAMLMGAAVCAITIGWPARARSAAAALPRGRASEVASSFARGVRAFRAGDYSQAERLLRDPAAGGEDWAVYLHAESAFYGGAIGVARADFEKLSRRSTSRFADVAAFRVADCQWSAGLRAEASERYRRLLARVRAHPAMGIDTAVARFRVAEHAEERHQPDAARLFLALYRDLPAHPLATEARRHLPELAPSAQTTTNAASIDDRLQRAETLSRDRHWSEALDELARLPAELTPSQAVERDFQIGMTKFQMRRDYGQAAALLLKIVPSLSGERAASALFHGTRALSRIDRDDEAIAGYKRVVKEFPRSRFAAEAQFLSGWLDFNRGRFRDGLPALQATLDHFGKSAFGDDAAWCVAFTHFLLGELPQAAAGLDRYAGMAATGMTSEERAARVAYWRARIDARADRGDRARAGYREVNRRWPFSFYGVLARARMAELGESVEPELARRPAGQASPSAPGLTRKEHAADATLLPTLVRANQLVAAGLDVEAGWEIERDEKALLRRLGESHGIPLLLARYPEVKAFHRAYEIGESRNAGALSFAPDGDPTIRLWWQAAYPLAYRELVDRFGPPAGNPELLLYAIMRKESGFSPWEVSTADARGLLQMIPPTSARVAADANVEFSPDQLFDPETNIRLGAAYIGALSTRFKGQIPIIAGAFNAGPKAMAKWCDQHGSHPVDEFVELIAFTQTREYAKRVVAIFARYRQLYGPRPYQLPLAVDAHYAATGPDY